MRFAAFLVAGAALAAAGAALAIAGSPINQPPPATTATAPATEPSPPPRASGLFGHVSRGPVSPTCRTGGSCYKPVRATLFFQRSGGVVARATSGQTGFFRVAMRPGLYGVTLADPTRGTLKPSLVLVLAGRYRQVNFVIGTKIY